jgi:hypothetical protein
VTVAVLERPDTGEMSKVWLADPLGIGDVELDTRMPLVWGDAIEAWQRKEHGRSFSDAVADLHIDLDRIHDTFRELNVTEVRPNLPVPAEVVDPDPDPEPIAWADFHEPELPIPIPIPPGVAVVRKAEWVPPPRRSHALSVETLPRRAASILEEGPAPDENMPGRALESIRTGGVVRPVDPIVIPAAVDWCAPSEVTYQLREDESWWSRLRQRWSWEWQEFKREIKRDLGFTDDDGVA